MSEGVPPAVSSVSAPSSTSLRRACSRGSRWGGLLAQREVIYSLPHTTQEHLLSTQCVVLKTSFTDEFRNFATEEQPNGCDNLLAILEENGYQLIATDGGTLQIYLRP